MEEKLVYQFEDGTELKIVLGEDGYNVNVISSRPLMGTFTSFENLLYGIAPVVQEHIQTRKDVEDLAMKLELSFSNVLVIDEVEEILLK